MRATPTETAAAMLPIFRILLSVASNLLASINYLLLVNWDATSVHMCCVAFIGALNKLLILFFRCQLVVKIHWTFALVDADWFAIDTGGPTSDFIGAVTHNYNGVRGHIHR